MVIGPRYRSRVAAIDRAHARSWLAKPRARTALPLHQTGLASRADPPAPRAGGDNPAGRAQISGHLRLPVPLRDHAPCPPPRRDSVLQRATAAAGPARCTASRFGSSRSRPVFAPGHDRPRLLLAVRTGRVLLSEPLPARAPPGHGG